MLCILLAQAARHEIIHKIHVKKWLWFFFIEVAKFSAAHIIPIVWDGEWFRVQALISVALLLKKRVLKRN